ncbi:MAG: 1-deoxy-D-xylulose-5-phosphate synthase [Clostridiales bacterium 38_11]|nr:MAG: 1-deoxy-D-xylulose-5-phosphate synthase [Clostridiales bacterium 38_11]
MYKILDRVNSIDDMKKLNTKELEELAEDIRYFLIDTISNTGGHLASNLGVVELTIAIHYVFDSPKDKIIFDVGHQSYVHKILTGRKNQFSTLRQFEGLSGFPKKSESEHDIFETGHSSTSISAALGLVNARDLKGEDFNVISLIGDGALSGGMALEAMNDAGRKKSNLIVILNDNEMSISKNVGSISTSLSRLRTGTTYYSLKKGIETFLGKIPIVGKYTIKFIRKIKESFKLFFVNGGMLFEELGFRYIGPVDGHDIEDLISILERVKDTKVPIVLHVHTKKGKGYKPAEQKPDIFHGVGKYDKETGDLVGGDVVSFSDVFGKKMVEMATRNNNIVAITAGMKSGTGLEAFAEKFPERFFDVGIAEQHGVTLSAGMASGGLIPIFPLYSTFLQRAYDQLVHDVALQNLHVILCVDRAGLVGRDGETHQGVFDSGFLYQIPNLMILTPSDFDDLEKMLEWSVFSGKGPIVIRYPRGSAEKIGTNHSENLLDPKLLRSGDDITLVTYGRLISEVYQAALELDRKGISAGVINLKAIKPLDSDLIRSESSKSKRILFVDETVKYGSVGRILNDLIPNDVDLRILSLPDQFIEHGSVEELTEKYGLDHAGIVEKASKWIGEIRN